MQENKTPRLEKYSKKTHEAKTTSQLATGLKVFLIVRLNNSDWKDVVKH